MGEKGKKRNRIIKLLKTEYRIGDHVPVSAIYECSDCWNVTAFKSGERFLPCEECLDVDDDQHWYKTNQVLHFVTKNVNTEFERIETFSLKAADWIAEISGSIWFVIFHVVWFGWWIWVNTMPGYVHFDSFPFGLLTMVVSLEAIFLSTFILISQNRQGQQSELRAELDYQTNINTEKQVAEILSILRQMLEEERLIVRTTNEVLEDANIILERTQPKRKTRKQRQLDKVRDRRADKIMEDAGIEDVDPDD
jgi:uncharacterized membrane protein